MDTAGLVPLSPVSFLERSGSVFADKIATVTRTGVSETYSQMLRAARRIAHRVLNDVGNHGVVAVLSRNGPELLKLHFGVPGGHAALLALNTRLSHDEYRFMLDDSDAQVLFVDPGLKARIEPILSEIRCPVIDLPDPESGLYADTANRTLDEWLGDATDAQSLSLPRLETDPISINYTSGTTGRPKAAVYNHRGAYLNSLSNVLALGIRPQSAYLWTLPMFHCNGWCCTWGVTAVGATHVTMADFDPNVALQLISQQHISHFCGAPVVASAIAEAGAKAQISIEDDVLIATGGSPPSPTTIARMQDVGIDVMHLYGLTETYGPSLICEPQAEWTGLPAEAVASLLSRQGVRTIAVESARVVDERFRDVPADAETIGEIAIKSNTVVGRYLNTEGSANDSRQDGWLRTGDLAVMHPDGYAEIRDRSKDIIISGGENVSSVEVENVLMSHPAVLEAAIVAAPHHKWGEVPVAYVELRDGSEASEGELIEFVRDRLAHFKAPKAVTFSPLPKTSTGKIQKHVLRQRSTEGPPDS